MFIHRGGSAHVTQHSAPAKSAPTNTNNVYHKGGFHQQSVDGDTAHVSHTPPSKPTPSTHSTAQSTQSGASAYNAYHKGGFHQQSVDGDSAHVSHTSPPKPAPSTHSTAQSTQSGASAYNAYHKGGFHDDNSNESVATNGNAKQQNNSQTNHFVGFAEANTGLTTWNTDKIPNNSAINFASSALGIGSIKNDINTLGSKASTGQKISAGADLLSEAVTDVSLLDGEGEAIRVGEAGEKGLIDATSHEGKTAASKTLASEGTGNADRQVVTSNLGKEIDVTPSSNHSITSKNPGPFGQPNSSVDILGSRTGDVVTRRWYGPDGRAQRDVDFTDHDMPANHPEVPHEHTWTYDTNGSPSRH